MKKKKNKFSINAVKEWLSEDNAPLSVKMVCIAAAFSAVANLLNIIVSIICGTPLSGIVTLILLAVILIIGVVYTVKTNRELPLQIILAIISFIFMPVTYLTSGGSHSGMLAWFIFSGVMLGTIVGSKFSIPCIVIYLLVNCSLLFYDALNPDKIMHLKSNFFALDSVNALIIVTTLLCLFTKIAIWQYSLKNSKMNQTVEQLSETLKQIETEKNSLDALSGIYNTVYLIDLADNTFEEIGNGSDRIRDLIRTSKEASPEDVQKIFNNVMHPVTCQEYRKAVDDFITLSTLPMRLEGKNSISIEIINDFGTWWRLMFVRVGSLGNDISKVIFTSQDIDDEIREKEKLIRLSNVDELTGISNRNAYLTKVAEIDSAKNYTNLWYMAFDLNNLKTTNDTYGHDAGDSIIRGTSKCLSAAIGLNGTVYRIGGDEFAGLIYADYETLKNILVRLENEKIDYNKSYPYPISYSLGYIAADEMKGAGINVLAREADRRMYMEKQKYYDDNPNLNRRVIT